MRKKRAGGLPTPHRMDGGAVPGFCPPPTQLSRIFPLHKQTQTVQSLNHPICWEYRPLQLERAATIESCSKWNNHYAKYYLNKNVRHFSAVINEYLSKAAKIQELKGTSAPGHTLAVSDPGFDSHFKIPSSWPSFAYEYSFIQGVSWWFHWSS